MCHCQLSDFDGSCEEGRRLYGAVVEAWSNLPAYLAALAAYRAHCLSQDKRTDHRPERPDRRSRHLL